ncbi:uncharacterized protein LOC106177003 [Lingula anatina]|uniref:Uncharacterized protein LOC106177003 n=1 Tax=Lingula anatina TaxID=7574 RepID=A0A2R2MR53_LINAN|nr:uncharacterized protein LOC106177003 [Lingula anatina]|eukprot:XP_023932628.1 uncharacterized protein LOC106177003 [Lingula anatina]
MIHAGVGHSQLQSIFSTLNFPPLGHNIVKRSEREIGIAIEEVAQSSTDSATQEEMHLLNAANTAEPKLEVSVDGGWQTRGSGRNYGSLSGHCAMIGTKTGKVLSYSVRSKKCRFCNLSQNQMKRHDCRMNWEGSAKAMEADMVVEMVKNSSNTICSIIGDEDSTTIARVHREVDEGIQKISDTNHIKKILTNQLYSLQPNHKQLSSKIIKYIQKNFSYMCQQNQGDIESIKKGLVAIPCHCFGDHRHCSSSWCGHLKNPESHKFRSLPYGRPLNDPSLKAKLQQIFGHFNPEKLCNLKSTQANENLNNIIASKAPKSKYYSGSESLNFRVGAAVAQKNEGQSYVPEVNRRVGVSPGANTIALAKKLDSLKKKNKIKRSNRKAKLRRLQLKAIKYSKKSAQELREGTSYSTNIDIETDAPDTERIPPPLKQPTTKSVCLNNVPLVYFDLETTGLGTNAHITQIAAQGSMGKFNEYVIPKKCITAEASAITGIKVLGGQIYHHDQPVEALKIRAALQRFIQFLDQSNPVLLVGHNIRSFDSRVLCNAAKACGMLGALEKNVCSFFDTLPFFRQILPGRKSYRQEELVYDCLAVKYPAHVACEDVEILKKLVDSFTPCPETMAKHCFDVNFVKESLVALAAKKKNLETLGPIKNLVSKSMLEKIASSGLQLKHIKLAFDRNSHQGVADLLGEKMKNGKPRVTKSIKIISSVVSFFH